MSGDHPVTSPAPETAGPEIVFAGTDGGAVTKLADYVAKGGFEALKRARAMTPDEVTEQVSAADLRGRGGAAFPTGRKWSFIPKKEQIPKPHYLVVNADESEPGSFKDREIMERVPFLFIEGCLIAAYAIDAAEVYIYIRGEYDRPFEVLRDALEEVRARGDLLGGVTIIVHRGAGAYICGEETALLESLEGWRGQPRSKPPFPAVSGLYASPTAVNNVESIATVVPIIEEGGKEYAKVGVENSTGTRVFSLSGTVANGGNFELESGTTLGELIFDLGGGIPGGRQLKAICPGGLSSPLLTAAQVDTGLDITSLQQAGSAIGSAGVIVLDDRCCIVQYALRASRFYEHESCGKCTPCRVGTRWLSQILQAIEDGHGTQADLDLLLDVCEGVNGKCLCPLGDSDALVVASCFEKFGDEFRAHVELGRCPLPDSPLEDVLAPVVMHERHRMHRELEVIA
jgi:NADH-quinone oxidoreductase subunit F